MVGWMSDVPRWNSLLESLDDGMSLFVGEQRSPSCESWKVQSISGRRVRPSHWGYLWRVDVAGSKVVSVQGALPGDSGV